MQNKKNIKKHQKSEAYKEAEKPDFKQAETLGTDHGIQEPADTSLKQPETGVTGDSKQESDPADKEQGNTVEQLTRELEEKNNQLLRIAAEFDNYKKRTERERLEIAAYAAASLLKAMLPAVDNIKRALEQEDTRSPEFGEGAVMTMRQFLDLLQAQGLSEIDPCGQPFNPEEHDAVMHSQDSNYGENQVVEVLQKGYKFGDTVLRPAMVKVVN